MNQQASSRRLVVYRLLEAHRLKKSPPIKQTEEDLFGLLVIDSGLGRNRVSTTLESARQVDDVGVGKISRRLWRRSTSSSREAFGRLARFGAFARDVAKP